MRITDLPCGPFLLDGGSIFGVVPKAKWTNFFTPDNNNNIALGLNPVLIEYKDKKVLIDTGMEKTAPLLIDKLKQISVLPEQITDVIFTHLHFDHSGGAVTKDSNGNFVLTFKNAIHYCTEKELELALAPDERTKHFYNSEKISYLSKIGVLSKISTKTFFDHNIYIEETPGHTEGHISVFVYTDIQHLISGDAIPTEYHLHLNYMTAFDQNLRQNLKTKKMLLNIATKRKTIIHLYHSSKNINGYLTKEEKRYKLDI
jgi:glyoxylase-like metal-dependent hydrolase (beta-lactamase superfamily II)